MAEAALTLADVTLGYERHPAVHHLSGVVEKGALLAVVGPNGGGKSTLLKGLAGRLRPLSGAIRLRAPALAYMPQIADLNRDFPVSVFDLALTGLCARRGLFRGISRADRERAERAIARVGLTGFESRAIRTLSGGQLQRLLFARLMVQDAPLILLDEPFSAIDSRTIDDLLQLIAQWHGEGRTVIAVLHDLALVRAHFPQALLLARDPLGWGETKAVLCDANLTRARRMAEAFDRFAAECERIP